MNPQDANLADPLAGERETALAVADRLLSMGGAARVWEPEARRVRARLREAGRARSAGG